MRHARRQGRGFAIGLAGSLLVHAGFIAWLLVREPIEPAPSPAPPVAYRVELYDLPPEAAPAAPASPLTPALSPREPGERGTSPLAAGEPRAPASPPRAFVRRPSGARSGTPGREAGARREGAGTPRGGPAGGTPAPAEIGDWFAERGLGAEGSGGGAGDGDGTDLTPPLPRDVRRAIQDGPPGSGDARHRAARITGELHAADVSRYPDRSWTGLRDALGNGFAPSAENVGPAATDGVAGSFLRSYGGYAGEYGRTGSPYGDAPDAMGRANPDIASTSQAADGASRDPLGGGVEERMAAAGGWAPREVVSQGRVAVVAMEQDARGVVLGVWLVRSSGASSYDALAMKQVEKLRGQAVQAPWGAAITEWAFRTEVAITPFRAGLGGTFDLGSEGIKLETPLDPRVRILPPELVSIRRVEAG